MSTKRKWIERIAVNQQCQNSPIYFIYSFYITLYDHRLYKANKTKGTLFIMTTRYVSFF